MADSVENFSNELPFPPSNSIVYQGSGANNSSNNMSAESAAERWGKVAGVTQNREDRLELTTALPKWTRIYQLFGANGENSQDEVFVAVNAYFAVNGCSPEGKYARSILTASGTSAVASDVVKVTGRLEGEIRQFLRARMRDSYDALKFSPALRADEAACAAAEERGIPRHLVHLLADWFKGCEYLTAEEQDVYKNVQAKTLEDARVRRLKSAGDTGRRADAGDGFAVEVQTTAPVFPRASTNNKTTSY